MQEIKQLLLRLGTNPDTSEGIMTGPMADAHIQGYMNQGWVLFAVNPGAIDQGTSSLSVHYVLTRDGVTAKVAKDEKWAQTETPKGLEGTGVAPIDRNKWQTSEDPTLAPA